ncbi:MAG: peroxide stress protein YaaA [Actinobacteria bacterium]|nr:peroxide stress protein YaaA [Actinomycetota bacterium]
MILLPPSETKWSPARGKAIDLAALSFPELTQLRESLLDEELRHAPTTTAGRLYTGVLYAALDIPSLPAGAAKNVVVISAQFGALRMSDRVPAYRREMDAAYWRDGLRAPLETLAKGRVILDCRSATYATAWKPTGAAAAQRVHVAVVEEKNGVRKVVSHFAKKARGEVARHLLTSGAKVRTPEELAAAVAQAFTVELEPPAKPGQPYELTVVQRA